MFEARYNNDDTGAPAYDPAIMLRIVLFAYSKGITSSRVIASLCREHVVFMALSADTTPHFTTIADFVSTLGAEITRLFRDVLLVCDEAGLIGKEMFAIDGVKLPSNASKEWSGTKADLRKKADKMQRAVEHLLKQHREHDLSGTEARMNVACERQIETLHRAIEKVEGFLATHDDKLGKSGKPKQSNITDNESAKMPSSKGVLQGYDGLAMVDAKHQVIVHAEAFGEGQEHGLLVPMLEGTRETFKSLDLSEDILKDAKLTADAGYSSEANMQYLFEQDIDAYVADNLYRKRDPRFKDADSHKPTRESEPHAKPKKELKFQPKDFQLADDHSHCICPAGKRMYRSSKHRDLRGYRAIGYRAPILACRSCPLRAKCIRYPERTAVRQVAFFFGRAEGAPEKYMTKMKRKIDSDQGRYQYGRRLGVVEPVFGNIRHNKRLNRLTLRGKRKV